VSAYTKAVVLFPTLGRGDLTKDIYLYSCDDDSCTTKTQLNEYGHITKVVRWPKSAKGPGGHVPETWVFLPLTDNQAQYFQFWQKNGSNTGENCILGITAAGQLDKSATTCVGTTVSTPAKKETNGVPSISMSAAMFSKSATGSAPHINKSNTLPSRSITFTNGTSYSRICLQTDSSFKHKKCNNGGHKIHKELSWVINNSGLENGYNSGVAQVAAFKSKHWKNTGLGKKGPTYATNMEWTVWPQHDKNTMGPTTIDISLVNGFNVGAILSPDQDTVCSISDKESGAPYFVMYKAGDVMAAFPEESANALTLTELCPAGNEAPIRGKKSKKKSKKGCYSSCSFAEYHKDMVDEMCCKGSHNTPNSCTEPPMQPYVKNVDQNSQRVYSWAFNDWRGTFTCEPTASFTFTITDAF